MPTPNQPTDRAQELMANAPQFLTFAEGISAVEPDRKKCKGIAYSGGVIGQSWAGCPVVVNLAGMSIAPQVPIMMNHENSPGYRLGMTSAVINDGTSLTYEGEIDTSTAIGAGLVKAGQKWKWQASIGASNDAMEYLAEGTKATINGVEYNGDILVVSKSTLREISLVALGADKNATLEIAAHLVTAAENKPQATKEETKMAEEKIENTVSETADLAAVTARLEAQSQEIAKLKAQLERPSVQIEAKHEEASAADVLAAAVDMTFGNEVKDCRATEAAAKKFRSGLTMKQLYTEAAAESGWRGYLTERNMGECVGAIKAAFSNLNLPGILGNAVNKRIKAGFEYVEQAWREIAEVVSASDYKSFSTYTLNANGEFEEVPNGGKISHGNISEESYSNEVKRYGLMFAIDEIDIINDDMSAISQRAFQFGRKAGSKLNKLFWTKFTNDASFFCAANKNIVTSAGELSINSIGNLVEKFRKQTDSMGEYIGLEPAKLLVPAKLEATALKLFRDTEMRDTTASKEYTTGNPWTNRFKPVVSAYLTSNDDYYLLADPMVCATMQVAFLDGVQAPTIESNPTSFDTFGIQYRGKFNFGVAQADPKGGVKGDKA